MCVCVCVCMYYVTYHALQANFSFFVGKVIQKTNEMQQ